MTEFVKRIEQNIESARRSGEMFENGKVLMALVPEGAHMLALTDISNYMAGVPTVKHTFPFAPDKESSVNAIQMRGVSCFIVRSDVPQEMFVVAQPVPGLYPSDADLIVKKV